VILHGLVAHVIVAHQFNHVQVHVHGQFHDTVLSVVQFAHRFAVGSVFGSVQLAVQHAQFTINLHSFQFF
jgi:hypothetical protein